MARVAIIYYSATGNTHQIAEAIEEGAREAGAETRLRRVRELSSAEEIAADQRWQQHTQAIGHIPEATHDDLTWADGYLFGAPTRYGAVAAPLKHFFDTTASLWSQGLLANKPVAAFTGAFNDHGGQETTLLTIYNVMYHWGAIIVPPGYTDRILYGAGGNPYGVSYSTPCDASGVPGDVLAAARYMGGRIARYADVIAANRDRLVPTQPAAVGAVAAGS